jgi:hypothetical protein
MRLFDVSIGEGEGQGMRELALRGSYWRNEDERRKAKSENALNAEAQSTQRRGELNGLFEVQGIVEEAG